MNRQKREDQIMEAAMRVFSRRGYNKTNVSELVSQAGVARGTFYLYFRSKRDVMTRLIERFMTQILQSASKTGVSSYLPGEPLPDYFRKVSSDLISCLAQNRRLAYLVLTQLNTLDREVQAKTQVYMDQLTRVVKTNIEAGIRQGLFRSLDAETAARCVIGAVKEWLLAWVAAGEEFELESRIVGMIDFLLAGLMPVMHDAMMLQGAAPDHAGIDDTVTSPRPGPTNIQ